VIKFSLPEELNAEQLVNEIEENGISINRDELPLIDGNKDFWLAVDEKDREAVQAVLDNHKAVFKQPTIEDKLASVGLSLDELKAAILGGN